MRTLIAAAAITLAACSTASPDPGPTSHQLDQLLTFRRDPTLQPYRYSNGVSDAGAVVIRDAAEWERAWQRIVVNHSPKPAAPAVDFSREMVLLVAMGTKSSGGYTAEIQRAVTRAGGLEVDWAAVSPGSNCFTTAALTQPIDVVIVPRVEGEVAFARHDQTRNC
ncbi:MAG TPA: protease complex subunit PrcB family protein [Allosphingosinicella sp.]|nr:protease complex subunit PrcB family protein [Gemmatimonadaceae bacterium]HEX2762423.1 protease complex subunit PrcB family protein [Allosphingosinicella sp.]